MEGLIRKERYGAGPRRVKQRNIRRHPAALTSQGLSLVSQTQPARGVAITEERDMTRNTRATILTVMSGMIPRKVARVASIVPMVYAAIVAVSNAPEMEGLLRKLKTLLDPVSDLSISGISVTK